MADEEQKQAQPPVKQNPDQAAANEETKFNFSSIKDNLNAANAVTDAHDYIIKSQFVGDSNQIGSNGEECVDIVTEYYWIQNKPNMTGTKDLLAPVPFCYAIEYKQRHGVTATNIANNILAIGNVGKNIIENAIGKDNYDNLSQGLTSAFDKVKTTISKALSSTGEDNSIVKGIGDTAVNFVKKLAQIKNDANNNVWGGNTHLNTELLSPYFYLYSLEATGKKFCFPFLTDGAASWTVANSFSADGSTSILTKALTETMDTLLNDGLVKFAADVQDLSNLLSAQDNNKVSPGFTMYNIEKAKAFAFPSGGKTVRVRFPLFNTIKVDAWKDNYKFIMLFGLRNMLFRKNNVQYYPPLFYDVSIPGFGRMPLSYVKSFTVKPVGMTRIKNIRLDNIGLSYGQYQQNKETSVIVPEAWVVDIEFESLIADSANQMLSSMFDLPVSVNIKSSKELTSDWQNQELTTVNLHNNAQLERMNNIT